MRKVIDGKVYNTETATKIGFTEYGTKGDYKYCHEALFKTPRGRFFLEYHGGALSRYAIDEGPHLVSGSSGIRLLTEPEALSWCEAAGFDASVIETHFTVEEG